jgi:hypothetical protein
MGVAEWSLVVSVAALLIAVAAILLTWRSDRRAAMKHALDVERRDVVWVGGVDDAGELWVRNDGQDPAIDVHLEASVRFSTPSFATSLSRDLGRMEPGQQWEEIVPGVRDILSPKPAKMFNPYPRIGMSYSFHLTWRSPLGSPGSGDVAYSPYRR